MIQNILAWHKSTYKYNWLKHIVIGSITYFLVLIVMNPVAAYFFNAIIIGFGWELFWYLYKNKKIDGLDLFFTQLTGLLYMVYCLITGII